MRMMMMLMVGGDDDDGLLWFLPIVKWCLQMHWNRPANIERWWTGQYNRWCSIGWLFAFSILVQRVVSLFPLFLLLFFLSFFPFGFVLTLRFVCSIWTLWCNGTGKLVRHHQTASSWLNSNDDDHQHWYRLYFHYQLSANDHFQTYPKHTHQTWR